MTESHQRMCSCGNDVFLRLNRYSKNGEKESEYIMGEKKLKTVMAILCPICNTLHEFDSESNNSWKMYDWLDSRWVEDIES